MFSFIDVIMLKKILLFFLFLPLIGCSEQEEAETDKIVIQTVKNILIDTSPDLRHQLIKNNITNIDLVIYSHMHGDQVHGINDLRIFSLKNSKKY